MIDLRLYLLQRASALVLLPLVMGHIGVMIFAIQGGLSAQEILSRTQGSTFWAVYYGVFVIAVAIHGSIGFRAILFEWCGLRKQALSLAFLLVFAGLLVPGILAVRAVVSWNLSRTHPLWWAYIVHRLSGLALVVFLPFHFWVLSLALNQSARLDGFLRWTDAPLVKFAEIGLVFLLAAHAFGGLRLMALETLGWNAAQKTAAAVAISGAAFLAMVFGIRAI